MKVDISGWLVEVVSISRLNKLTIYIFIYQSVTVNLELSSVYLRLDLVNESVCLSSVYFLISYLGKDPTDKPKGESIESEERKYRISLEIIEINIY